MIKYVSDVTNKSYDSAEEAEKAEKEYTTALAKKEADKKALAESKKVDAQEIKDLMIKRANLNKEIGDKISDFCKKYNSSFHMSLSGDEALNSFDSLFDDLWNHLWF